MKNKMARWLIILTIYGLHIRIIFTMIVEPEWKIYYDVKTNETIDIIDSNNPRVQYYKAYTQKILRIGFGPIPCSCQEFTCGCCAGMNIEYFNFNQKGCMNFTYDPEDFSLTFDMLMNDNSLFAQSFSGKNPPPACMPIPIPYLPAVDFCIRFFNIHTPGYNIFMCIDFETRIERAPVLVLHFDCMQMGADGIQYHKPEDSESGPDIEDADTGIQNEEESEIYDEVYEEDEKNVTSTMATSMSAVTTRTDPTISAAASATVAGISSEFESNKTTTQKGFMFNGEIYDEVYEEDTATNKTAQINIETNENLLNETAQELKNIQK